MIIWCSHCPASVAQMVVPDEDADMFLTAHIVANHPDSGAWVQGDDWDIISPAERGELAQHVEHISA